MVESISKTPVTAEQAAAVVERAFGPDAALASFTECTEGWFNAVHRLALADGTSCILKVAPPPDVRVLRYEHDLLTTEVEALRLVRERTDVPVPEVLAWDEACDLLPTPYFLMTACPGRLLSEVRGELTAEGSTAVDAELCRLVAQVNAVTAESFGRPDRAAPHDPTWRAAFGRLVDDLLADGADAGVELPVPYEEVAAHVARHGDALDEVAVPRLVHWDLWDPNVFVDPATGAVVGVIDFERVLWADPLMEAQFTARRADDERTEAYGRALFAEPGAVARRRLYDLYLSLVMTIESAYRNYPTSDIEDLARSMLAGVLDELART